MTRYFKTRIAHASRGLFGRQGLVLRHRSLSTHCERGDFVRVWIPGSRSWTSGFWSRGVGTCWGPLQRVLTPARSYPIRGNLCSHAGYRRPPRLLGLIWRRHLLNGANICERKARRIVASQRHVASLPFDVHPFFLLDFTPILRCYHIRVPASWSPLSCHPPNHHTRPQCEAGQ